ncbi:MAG: FAD-binding and (Fe-S)-binding domain-containing protein [Chitinophagaceae bacterium]
MDTLIKSLCRVLPAERVKTKLIDLVSFASDAGFYHLTPRAVVQPINVAEVQQLFAVAREHQCPMVFRAGGTSLSGQCITDGILVDISQHWRNMSVAPDGKTVTVQPGITGGMVNHYLKKYTAKIGPDPASINAAMMGGILSNNASGMCCGVAYNSYHTMQTTQFVLADGSTYNTAVAQDYRRFENEQATICNKLTDLHNQVAADQILYARIRKKYQTKNTVGYGLNALADYGHPLDMLAHLLIGAEGTLGFIAEATLLTLPDKPHKATAVLYFPGIYEACAAIVPLKDSGAAALELMDRASLRSVAHLPGLPDFFTQLPEGAAAILCEYQAETAEELGVQIATLDALLPILLLLHPASFTTDEYTRNFYWKIRKGMFPSVGAVRQRGSTVILEDIAVPVEKLADAVLDLQELFREFGYENAIIFGHAKDGNIHFVLTQLLDNEAEIKRYDHFLRAVIDLVLKKYDGALKAEHGTGRNMAPFVEAEWGGAAYQIMQQIKLVVDPHNLLNPGVIISKSTNAHLEHLKQMPVVEEEVDKCIECGFCEPNCPSRDITTTPRRRIVVRRALQLMRKNGQHREEKQLLKEYQYHGLDTCATDGLCATDCPVDINTGELVKRLRNEQHGKFSNNLAALFAKHFKAVENSGRFGIRMISAVDRLFNWKIIGRSSAFLHKIIPSIPVWVSATGKPPAKLYQEPANPQVVYFTACINRLMSSAKEQRPTLQQTFLSLCKKAGIEVLLPKDITGHCCGQPFSSKGFKDAALLVQEKAIDALLQWTNNGELPVVIDFTSCTYTFLHNMPMLSPAYKIKFLKLRLVDSITFLNNEILPKITIYRKAGTVAVHPVCAATKLYLNEQFLHIAKTCANEVIKPAYAGCCGMAGDRGFLVPELTESATHMELAELKGKEYDGYYASSTTCEISLTQHSGKRYEHIMYLVDEVSNMV